MSPPHKHRDAETLSHVCVISSSVVMGRITIGIQGWKWFCRKKTYLGYDPNVWILQEVPQPSLRALDIKNCYLINLSEEISAAVELNIQTQIKCIFDTFTSFLADMENLLCISHMYFGEM